MAEVVIVYIVQIKKLRVEKMLTKTIDRMSLLTASFQKSITM